MVLELLPKTKLFTDIAHPYATVLLHATLKGIQAGLIMGFVAGSCVALYKKVVKKKKHFSWKKVIVYMGRGMVFGVILVGGMTLYKMRQSDWKQNQSRAFRLKNNRQQNIVDNFTIASLVVGQVALRNLEEQEMGGGLVGALAGFVLINIVMAIFKDKI